MATAYEFWEHEHAIQSLQYLTGNNIGEVLHDLRVDGSRIKPGVVVLNIGVGDGGQYPGLARMGCEIWSLDISPIGLKKAAAFGRTFLPSDLPHMPRNAVDVALSRLVAQHMHDAELLVQMRHVFEILKPFGFLAIQFAGVMKDQLNDTEVSQDTANRGGKIRTNAHMVSLVERAGGEAFFNQQSYFKPHDGNGGVFWRSIHARRKSDHAR